MLDDRAIDLDELAAESRTLSSASVDTTTDPATAPPDPAQGTVERPQSPPETAEITAEREAPAHPSVERADEWQPLRADPANALAPHINEPDQRVPSAQEVIGHLRFGEPLDEASASGLLVAVELLLARQPAFTASWLRTAVAEPGVPNRLVTLLPERLLIRLLLAMRPDYQQSLHRAIDTVAETAIDTLRAHRLTIARARVTQLKWEFLLRHLGAESSTLALAPLLNEFIDQLAVAVQAPSATTLREWLIEEIRLHILPATQDTQRSVLHALDPRAPALPSADERPPEAASGGRTRSQRDARSGPPIPSSLYVTNAGLILSAPYLPQLFRRLELVDGSSFRDEQAAERAVQLTQFLVTGDPDTPEYSLPLNKLLCGVPLSRPIARLLEPAAHEVEALDGLIQGMIQNWPTVRNTSVSGFRESFLQREASLQQREDGWHMAVARRPFDMLLDTLPWSFSTVKLPWMEQMLYTEWEH